MGWGVTESVLHLPHSQCLGLWSQHLQTTSAEVWPFLTTSSKELVLATNIKLGFHIVKMIFKRSLLFFLLTCGQLTQHSIGNEQSARWPLHSFRAGKILKELILCTGTPMLLSSCVTMFSTPNHSLAPWMVGNESPPIDSKLNKWMKWMNE